MTVLGAVSIKASLLPKFICTLVNSLLGRWQCPGGSVQVAVSRWQCPDGSVQMAVSR